MSRRVSRLSTSNCFSDNGAFCLQGRVSWLGQIPDNCGLKKYKHSHLPCDTQGEVCLTNKRRGQLLRREEAAIPQKVLCESSKKLTYRIVLILCNFLPPIIQVP